jgi:hypothetical protein
LEYNRLRADIGQVNYLAKGWIESIEKVRDFIAQAHAMVIQDYNNLHIVEKHGIHDKTREFREEYRLTNQMVCEEILKLDETNYSYTDIDKNATFRGVFWMFGQFILPPLVDRPIELYIKLKIQKKVICMSFHKKEENINYPHLNH